MNIPIMRPYQERIIEETRTLIRQGVKNILITAPTGSGKTILTAHMLKKSAEQGVPAWFIVHRRELVKQSIDAFNSVGVRHGVIAAGFMEAKRVPIQIASIQTLIKRYQRYPKPRIIVFDECHHCSAGSWNKIYQALPEAYHIGLTATPQRLDGVGLGNWFSKIVHGPQVAWLIENGFLSPYKIYAPSHINTEGIHTRMGDFAKEELALAVDRPTITGDAIKHYIKYANGKRAVVFCVSIDHSKHVIGQFNASGISALHVDGETPTEERDEALRKFRAGEVKIISNVELFGEGFDLPAMEADILLRPTQSLGLYLQQVGRSLRPYPGKEQAIILDHAGNCQRHGLPDEERNWELSNAMPENKRKGEKSVSVKVCPKCFAAQFSGLTVCKYCGFTFPVQGRRVDEREGELVEVNAEAIRKRKRAEQGMTTDYNGLVALAIRRRYRNPWGWAKIIFNARQAKKLAGVGA